MILPNAVKDSSAAARSPAWLAPDRGASGHNTQFRSGTGSVGIRLLRRVMGFESLKARFQIGAALLHLLSQFAAGKSGEGGVAKPSPGRA